MKKRKNEMTDELRPNIIFAGYLRGEYTVSTRNATKAAQILFSWILMSERPFAVTELVK